jgi:predicted ATP-dependent protease
VDTGALIREITERKDTKCVRIRERHLKKGMKWMCNAARANGVATRYDIIQLRDTAKISHTSATKIARMAEETLLREYVKEMETKRREIAEVKRTQLRKKQKRQEEEWIAESKTREQRDRLEAQRQAEKRNKKKTGTKRKKSKQEKRKTLKQKAEERAKKRREDPCLLFVVVLPHECASSGCCGHDL